MVKRVAKFEKVTYGQFEKDWLDTFDIPELDTSTRREIESIYGAITLPKRATKGSAGYDFVSPLTFTLKPGETIKIPTGIRCEMNTDWVLMLYPRSGLGFKFKARLCNTVGVVDSDFYYSDNEGHIFVKLSNEGDKEIKILRGNSFCQGIFMEYGITEDDKVETSFLSYSLCKIPSYKVFATSTLTLVSTSFWACDLIVTRASPSLTIS